MADVQLSSKFQYIELLADSAQTDYSENTGYSSLNWPKLNYENRGLNPAGFKVLSAELKFSFNTLLEEENRMLLTTEFLGVPTTVPVYVPPGSYTADTLIDALKTALDNSSSSPGWTIVWSEKDLKFTFSYSTPFTFDFRPIGNLQTSLYKFLGFKKNGVYTSSGTTLTSDNIANPSGPQYLYLNSNTIGTEIKALVQNNSQNVAETQICRIPIDVPYGSFIFYNDPSPNNYFDFVEGFKFQNLDLYFTIESSSGYKVVDFKGASFSVKIGLLTYRSGGSSITTRPSNSRYAGM